ncbi:hypothetical protein M271_30380 [Streptomyces rapamycinicus NRRL 5491]|uniref:DUF1707 domain-containing protein n=2 Tax=Streptomyces rapamycinicus TaxID=1226757 RepID=A0A0A0NDG9_STRRN|nr:hypothetical protein M271_30380 [Streptomyces rapamycinicus NRRL 5491]RLV79356.1 hypothetical protein D3C57_113265 [Streptomyces rapamycinicus NRRL 5491]
MRASDAERERIAEVLREAVAEGRLDMEEFEERLGAAYAARTHGQLEPLVRDLPVPGSAAPAPPSPADRTDRTGWAERIGGTPTSKWAVAIMGGFQRKGTWTVPRAFTAFTIMGGGEIDLREARFEGRDVVIRCFALMGGIEITVPPDLETHVSGIGLMGGFDHTGSADGDPTGPRVTVTGLALFGGVSVERKLRREEHKRMKEERRRLKAEHREELRAERRELRGARRDEREERRFSLEKERRED